MATTVITGVQYSGIWSLAGQANAKAHTGLPWSDKRRDAYNKKQAKIKEMREANPA